MNPIPRDELERENAKLRAELTQVYANLTNTQARCTELLEETRALKRGEIDAQVRAFHDVMGIENRETLGIPSPEVVRLRMRLIIEEAFEFVEACVCEEDKRGTREVLEVFLEAISKSVELDPDLVEIADALADLDYVVAGTRLAYGIPRAPVADEVHRSNMTKAPGGKVYRDDHGKVSKPPGWTPPDIARALVYGAK